jgi:HAD superfamily hydrolase (TIGR01509 family)
MTGHRSDWKWHQHCEDRGMPGTILDGFSAVLLDVDGTLVDSNDRHADAWTRAFHEAGYQVDPAEVRTAIGMGADQLMPRVSRLQADSPEGRRIAERRGEIFRADHLPQLRPFPGARDLVIWLKQQGLVVVAASSATRDELDRLLAVAGVAGHLDASTSSDDAKESKPEPDIVHAAVAKAGVGAGKSVMIGDTPYDVEAASAAGVASIAFRTGGWPDVQLGGALAIYDGPRDLLDRLTAAAA